MTGNQYVLISDALELSALYFETVDEINALQGANDPDKIKVKLSPITEKVKLAYQELKKIREEELRQ